MFYFDEKIFKQMLLDSKKKEDEEKAKKKNRKFKYTKVNQFSKYIKSR